MGRNKQFIEQEKRFRRAIHEILPGAYAAVAISLHRRYKFGKDRIVTVISDAEKLLTEQKRNGWQTDIIKMCSEETGVDILSPATARECGVSGDEGKE